MAKKGKKKALDPEAARDRERKTEMETVALICLDMFSTNIVSLHLGESFCCEYSPWYYTFIVGAFGIFASSRFLRCVMHRQQPGKQLKMLRKRSGLELTS